MYYRVGIFLTAAALLGLSGARADDDATDLRNALALQRTMQKAIHDVEPAIACILVSRSDAYKRFAPLSSIPGKLGAFDAMVLHQPGLSDELRKKLNLADPAIVPESFGSGVVVDPGGLVLTNFHVVRGATKVFVRLPGNKGSYADIHAADTRSDLAVLRLLTPPQGLKAISLGDAGKCQRGQFVLSIANPFAAGFRDGQPSASWGILSNIRRRAPGGLREDERTKTLHHYGTLLQTDARLNLGCSGGALINLQGEMIGLTTALAAIHGGETPGGFAVPMDAGMRRILAVLLRGEEVEYGFLGIGFRGPSRGRDEGVMVDDVIPGSAAQRDAQLAPRDMILEVDGAPVHETEDLFLALGTHLTGSRIRLKIRRPGRAPTTVEVTLTKFNAPGPTIASAPGKRPIFRGLRVDYTSLLAQRPYSLRAIPPGVMISEVQANSTAATAQLKVGEVITHVNGVPVNSPADFYLQVNRLAGRAELTLGPNQAAKVVLN
jgi:serine protease Do